MNREEGRLYTVWLEDSSAASGISVLASGYEEREALTRAFAEGISGRWRIDCEEMQERDFQVIFGNHLGSEYLDITKGEIDEYRKHPTAETMRVIIGMHRLLGFSGY